MRSLMFLSAIPRLVIDTLAVTTMVAVALLLLARGQDLQSIFPVLGLFAAAAIRLMPSASRIANGLATLRFHYAATEVIYQALIDTEEYVTDPGVPEPERDREANFGFERSLVLEHLSYRYPSMPGPAIDDVSLEIPKGDWVGLIGPTGAGKTTLIDLILGLYVPTSGRILVDGRDMKDDVAGWQRNLGYVPQDVYMMDDTVRRNVAFGLADQEIDDDGVWQALRDAQIDGFVRLLPGGLDAMIGERGDRLSGGERQRLGIARALYRDPEVLVVDEGTANLDNETEAAIVRTLAALKGNKTIIAISHRLAFVRDCDRVYLLKQGKVRNSGTVSELASTESAFREFAGSAA
jgi:ABC-type multidrug transport system fused ATPase/permease subunit